MTNKNTRTIGERGSRENNEIPCPVVPLPEFESFRGSVARPTASVTSTSSTTWSRAVTLTQQRGNRRAQFHCFRWSQHSSSVKAKQRLPASRQGSAPGLGAGGHCPVTATATCPGNDLPTLTPHLHLALLCMCN